MNSEPMLLDVAFSRAGDEQLIRDFYTGNPHPNIAFRKSLTADTARRGNFVLVSREGTLVGCGGAFVHDETSGRPLIELGQARVTLPGYNQLPLMTHLRLLKVFTAYPGVDTVFIQVVDTNRATLARAETMGYRRIHPDARLVDLVTAALPRHQRAEALGVNTVYLSFSRSSFANVRAAMRRQFEGGGFIATGRNGSARFVLTPSAAALVRDALTATA